MAQNYYLNKLDIDFLIKNIKKVEKPRFLVMNENTLKSLCKSGYYVERRLKEFKGGKEEYLIFENIPITLSWSLDNGEIEII